MKTKLLIILLAVISLSGRGQTGITAYPFPLTMANTKTCFVIDANNNKWIGTFTMGLVKFNGSTWTTYDTLNSNIADNYIRDVCFDATNKMYVGTNKGLSRLNGITWNTYTTLNSALPTDTIQCLASNGNIIWVGTKQGLLKYNGSTWTLYNTGNSGLPTNLIQCLEVETNGTVWVGTKLGLLRYNGSAWYNYSTADPYYPCVVDVTKIFIDGNAGKKYFYGNTTWNISQTSKDTYVINGNKIENINTPLYQYPINFLYPVGKTLCRGPQAGLASTGRYSNVNGIYELAAGQVYFYKFNAVGKIIRYEPSTNKIWSIKNQFYNDTLFAFDYSTYALGTAVTQFTNETKLDINNVSAGICSNDALYWNQPTSQYPAYEVPKGTGKNADFASSLWIGGYDEGGALHLSGQTYRQYDPLYQVGPLDTITGIADSVTNLAYQKVWKIDRFKIEEFKYNFTHGNVQNGTYIPDNNILTWPARGSGNITRNLAPFVDVNNNGIYNPLVDGDYPKIKGDQMCYFIFNDSMNVSSPFDTYKALQIEVHASAYAYTCPTIADSNKVLNYSTFYSFDIINRSPHKYDKAYISIWADSDLGYYLDDYVGCNRTGNYGFLYNGRAVDGTGQPDSYGQKPPMQSTVILKGPLAEPNDTIDNNNNGIVDETNEENLMTNFIYFNNTPSPINGNPNLPLTQYYYMTSHWGNGQHITYGSNGTDSTSFPYNFMYDGIPDTIGWTEHNSLNVPDDRRFVMSCGPFVFDTQQTVTIEYAKVYTRDTVSAYSSYNLFNKNLLDVKRIQRWYANNSFPSCLNLAHVGINDIIKPDEEVSIYPNPTKGVFLITTNANQQSTIKIYNVLGEEITHSTVVYQSTIDLSNQPKGIYFVRIEDENKNVVNKKIVLQ